MRISDWSSDVCSSDLVGVSGNERRIARVLRDVGLVHRGSEAVKMLIIARDYRDPAAVTTAKTVGGREIAVASTEPIGRAWSRARVGQYVSMSVVTDSLTQQICSIVS